MIAIMYRMVSGFVETNTFLMRMRWSLYMGLVMGFTSLVTEHDLDAILFVTFFSMVTAYLGRLIPHGDLIARDAALHSTLVVCAIGLGRVALLLAPSAYFDPWVLGLAAFGLLMGPIYRFCWKFLVGRDSGFYYKTQSFAHIDNSWAEVITGFVCYQIPVMLIMASGGIAWLIS